MFDTIGQAVLLHDGITVRRVNDALRELFRYPSCEAMLRLSVFDLVARESADLVVKRSDRLRHEPGKALPDAQYICQRADRTSFIARVRTRDYRWSTPREPCEEGRLIFWSHVIYLREVDDRVTG
jgi:PAS domain-containing protein